MKLLMRLLIVCLMMNTIAHAKKVISEEIPVQKEQDIILNLKFPEKINLVPYKGNKLIIYGEIEVNDGENDDAYSVTISQNKNQIKVESHIDNKKKKLKLVQHFDEDGNLVSSYNTMEITGSYKVKIPIGYKVKVKSINANLEIRDTKGPIKAETINGEIDLLLPRSSNVDVSISTINGDCYTDLDFEHTGKKKFEPYGKNKSRVRLNDGGRPIDLSTINGIMYLRKG